MVTTTNYGRTEDLPPSEVKRSSKARVRAPFAITTMHCAPHRLRFWLWARRGGSWVIEQEMFLGADWLRSPPLR